MCCAALFANINVHLPYGVVAKTSPVFRLEASSEDIPIFFQKPIKKHEGGRKSGEQTPAD